MMDISIKNCKIVFPTGIISGAGVGIDGEKIVTVVKEPNLPKADKVIDAKGNYLIPGVIEPHSHLAHIPRGKAKVGWEVAYGQEIKSETGSAAAGGVTTFFTKLPGQGLKMPFEDVERVVGQNAMTDMAFHVGIGTDQHLQEIPKYADLGITSYKFHMVEHPKWGVTAADDGLIYLGLRSIRDLGYPALPLFHCENLDIIRRLKEKLMKEGRTDLIAWTDSRPNFCEAEAMKRVMYFAEVLNAPLYIVHMSIREGVELVAEQKAKGLGVIAETCPHYLTLTKYEKKGVLVKVNPPLREKEDIEALWMGIRNGVINCIGSDHVVNTIKYQLELGLWDDHNAGFAGTETMLPVMLSEGVNKGRISFERLVEVCSYNTAKAFGIFPKKGAIQIGSDADLTIVDLNKEVTVTPEVLHSASDYTIYDGWKFRGWPVATILRGNIVMENGDLVGKPGCGKYLPRKLTTKGRHV